MKKKPGFSLQQHKTAGARLVRILSELESLHIAASRAYPVNKADSAFRRAIIGVIAAQNEMENLAFGEHHDGMHTAVYYAGECHNAGDADREL